ncbi:uncharacterized protein LOC124256237 [Haliotis rubra]|uniref:uncharacterized protein LOC124256237 n=1 Tax=Haliotis rubra TaxID=36100 RepID=UPI001EE57D10|nr:uncharacterized protein LOC124256237 [Haliotis rubra]
MNIVIDVLIISSCFVTCGVLGSHSATGNCTEPDIDKLRRDIPNLYAGFLDPTFVNLPRLKTIVRRKNGYIYPFSKKSVYFYGGYRKCSDARKVIRKNGGNLCPSYYILEYDPDRIPRELVQAECTCDRCFLRRRPRAREEVVAHLGCRKLYTNIQVLRRAGCIQGVWTYRLYWERVSVACSCNLLFGRPSA